MKVNEIFSKEQGETTMKKMGRGEKGEVRTSLIIKGEIGVCHG